MNTLFRISFARRVISIPLAPPRFTNTKACLSCTPAFPMYVLSNHIVRSSSRQPTCNKHRRPHRQAFRDIPPKAVRLFPTDHGIFKKTPRIGNLRHVRQFRTANPNHRLPDIRQIHFSSHLFKFAPQGTIIQPKLRFFGQPETTRVMIYRFFHSRLKILSR